jgi:hypothetical protein
VGALRPETLKVAVVIRVVDRGLRTRVPVSVGRQSTDSSALAQNATNRAIRARARGASGGEDRPRDGKGEESRSGTSHGRSCQGRGT